MKKSLIALATLALAGAASAQSSVTLFGVVDVALQRITTGGTDALQIGSGGYASSRLGFRGTEDLGGGMAASFWLEAGVNADNGSSTATSLNNQSTGLGHSAANISPATATGGGGLTFSRRSTVSLSGGWGEVRLGRDYVPQFWNMSVFDPFGTVGVGQNQAARPVTYASNSIGYFLPAKLFGGLYGQAQVSLGENAQNGASTEKDGNGYGVRVGYAAGPFNVAIAHGETKSMNIGDMRSTNLGGHWDFGMAKLMGVVSRDRTNASTGKGALIGALFPIGAGEVRASLSQYTTDVAVGADPRSRKLALGYVHNLSKRTAVYTTVARVRNSGGAGAMVLPTTGTNAQNVPNGSSTGFDLGVRHNF